MSQKVKTVDSSKNTLPTVVFLGKHSWQGGSFILRPLLLFVNPDNDKNLCFFTSLMGNMSEFLSLVKECRNLYSRVYFLFPKGACSEEMLRKIDCDLPRGLPYEVFEIDECDRGRFFRRGSWWDLRKEKK